MNRLINRLNQLKNNNQKALVPFLTAGYPDINTTKDLVFLFEDQGADIIEIGVPFSDPIADGPTIQYASDISLKNGTTLKNIFRLISSIRQRSNIPIIIMSYINPILKHGFENTIKEAYNVGVDGFIFPDLIPEESNYFKKIINSYNTSIIYLTAPNTSIERLSLIDSYSDSFVYIVSLTGVTGKRKDLPLGLKDYLLLTKRYIKHPRFLGFGISGPNQIKKIKDYIDGVIVGSALIDILKTYSKKDNGFRKIKEFINSLRFSLD